MIRADSKRQGELSADVPRAGPFDGERKIVTVLFADIVQSSRLIADNDPEEADDRLLAVLQELTKAVRRYGGTVNQVLGDGVMALFGVPRAQEDHALRACLAAEAMHAAVTRGTAGVQSAAAPPVAIRVGLSSGEVVVNPPDDKLDRKYRAVGEPVYLAQRMEQAAPPGSTLVSRATLALAADKVTARPIGEVRLKPDSHPVEAFELGGIQFDCRPFKQLSRAGPISFIGRTDDLETLNGLLDEVEGGRGHALAITGEAGIGKSRLVFEFLEGVRDRWVGTVTCDLLPPGLARHHGPLAWLITRLLPSGSTDSDDDLLAAVDELLRSFEIEERYARSAICELLDLEAGDPGWAGLDPPERLQVAVETVSEIVRAMSRRQPLVLVFEDFHWADTETRRLAEELAGGIASSRVLLIVTARSHHEKTWASWPSAAERDLGPLSRTQTAEFLDVLLGADPELDDVKQLLVQKTEGNPFFLEECVRALGEAGSLAGLPGAHRLAVPVAELEIPGSVHDVLAARIDALPAPERTILLRASVIGQRVDVGLLENLQRQPKEVLLALLNRLEQAGFLERTRIMPNLEYSFRHALTHDVAYGTLLKRSRRYLHARVMAVIEGRRIEQLPSKVELLAYHALRAEDWPKACAYCRRAGQRAQARSANQEAVELFENALQAVKECPRTRRYKCREIDVRLELFHSLFPLGIRDQAHYQLKAAQDLAHSIRDEHRRANVASALVPFYWIGGDLINAIGSGRQALAFAERLKDLKGEVQLGTRLGALIVAQGDYESACQLLKATIKKIPKIPEEDSHRRFGLVVIASVACYASLARALGELGRFKEAIEMGVKAITIAVDAKHALSQIYARIYCGNALLRKGDFGKSLQHLQSSYELCKSTQTRLLDPLNAASLGYAYVRTGDVSKGLALLQDATAAAEKQAFRFQLSQELTWLGEACLLAGDHERAHLNARNALERAKENGEKGDEAWSLWLLGVIHSDLDSTGSDDPKEYLHKAHDIAVTRLMSPLAAHIEFALGKLYHRRNESDKALLKLESAVSLYRKLDMNYWLEDARTELAAARREARVPISLH